MKLLNFYLLVSSVTILSCSTIWKPSSIKLSHQNFSELKVGVDNLEKTKLKFGRPDEVYFLGKEKQIVDNSKNEQWIYSDEGLNRLYLYFELGVLVSKSWNVKEGERESSVRQVLKDYEANWTVIKEPISNPHSGPTECYLEDLQNGKMVKVNGYKKTTSEISIWIPNKKEKSIKDHLSKKVGKEFCIAKNCSRVTNPDAWEYNHCEWLEKLVAKRIDY